MVLKRFFDMVVSLTFICTLFPFFYVVLGAAIKLTSTGPILFRQQRSGLGNKPFTCLKFRTMVVNDEADILQATDNDKRITSIGHFLRRVIKMIVSRQLVELSGLAALTNCHSSSIF